MESFFLSETCKYLYLVSVVSALVATTVLSSYYTVITFEVMYLLLTTAV